MLQFILRRLALYALVITAALYLVNLAVLALSFSTAGGFGGNLLELARASVIDTRDFLGNVIGGDLGVFRPPIGLEMPVAETIRLAFQSSMGLMLIASTCSAILGVGLGVFAALTKVRGLRLSVLSGTLVGISLPSFFAAMLLQNTIIVIFRETGRRYLSVAGMGWDYQHLVLPVLVLMARPVAYIMRTTYIAVDRTMQDDYIRTAYSKGLGQRAVVSVHALRNVAVPIMTAIGVSWRFSLGILPIVENIFAWWGMGLYILYGIQSRQSEIVLPLAGLFGLVLLFSNLFLEILYRLVDPRLREAHDGAN